MPTSSYSQETHENTKLETIIYLQKDYVLYHST